MTAETFAIAILVFIAGFTGFYLGIKADMWAVKKAARLGVHYVVKDDAYRVVTREEWDAVVKAANAHARAALESDE